MNNTSEHFANGILSISNIFHSHRASISIECFFLTIIGVLLGHYFGSERPFYSVPGFSWLSIGPMLIALRYGFLPALLSILCIVLYCVTAIYFYQFEWDLKALPLLLLPTLWFVFIISKFQNYWKKKHLELSNMIQYVEQQHSELSNSYKMISLSHDKLQEHIISGRSIRNSLSDIKKSIDRIDNQGKDLGEISEVILQALSDFAGGLDRSAFYLVHDENLDCQPIASLGGESEINKQNPLLIHALKTKSTTCLRSDIIENHEYIDNVLLAIPLTNQQNNVIAMIVVHKMPFRNYRPDIIKSISHYADYLIDIVDKQLCLNKKNLNDVDSQIYRSINDMETYQIQSVLYLLTLKNKFTEEIFTDVLSNTVRSLDKLWKVKDDSEKTKIYILLPITPIHIGDNFIRRLEQLIDNHKTLTIDDYSVQEIDITKYYQKELQ